jgi:hypothetical protein
MIRTLHALATGLWFGAVAFFTVAGVLILGAFNEVSQLPFYDRPLWFPAPAEFERAPLGEGFPDPTRLEQASRAFGVAVGGVFPFYFALQAACAGLALLTALALGGPRRARLTVCLLGLVAVLAGWWLEHRVSALRGPRNDLTDEVLKAGEPTAEQIEQAAGARAAFGRWHGWSLLANFATLALAGVACGLGAHTFSSPTRARISPGVN